MNIPKSKNSKHRHISESTKMKQIALKKFRLSYSSNNKILSRTNKDTLTESEP